MLLPVLTAYEKEHISERQPLPERYLGLSDEEMDRRIAAARCDIFVDDLEEVLADPDFPAGVARSRPANPGVAKVWASRA